jgi:hypothetical protein
MLMLGPINQEAWNDLMHVARTGQSAFEHHFSMNLWHYCSKHLEYSELFDSAMAGFTMTYIEDLVNSYSFSPFEKLVDVGGGDGSLLIGILKAHPNVSGVVYDLPKVVDRAAYKIDQSGLTGRCQAVSGDAFADVPQDGDAYILSRVLHDWDDDRSCVILLNCRAAMREHGRILVIERVMPDFTRETLPSRDAVLSDICMTDLNMMVMTSGRERTLNEFLELCTRTGLELVRVVRTRTAMSVLELRAIPRPF